MNTIKSDALVKEFQKKTSKARRKIQNYKGTFSTSPEKLFPLLCPARECDWIQGWDCELIYTDSGYAEDNCVFQTDESSSHGPGLWTFTRYEPNKILEIIRITPHFLTHIKISVIGKKNGTTTSVWTLIFTGLTEEGNNLIDQMPDKDENFDMVISALDYYLQTGEMMKPIKPL